ncbi:MAG: O-antigen ligase family protein [Bacteroides sp.]|nr:O-antigen ligase family protein [Bacteroides sp.]
MVSCKAISRLKVWEPVALVLLVMGVWECGLGWAQLFGIAHSRHALYPATGTFYNPGPFCGFLAMILPAALQYIISPRQRLIHWVALAYFITAVAIMPVLMGRTGWIAAVAGCLVAAAGCGKIRRPRRWMLPAIAVASAAGVGVMLYLKPASALGRLLLWRIGVDALMEHPLTGVGWHHVAGALGQAQEAYFHYRPYSVFAGVAGSPDYAFNEFLQIGIAFGIPSMLLFAAAIALAAVAAWRGQAFGIAGGLTAFATVCLASYPLQFPEFIAAAGLMMIGAVTVVPCRCLQINVGVCMLLLSFSVWVCLCRVNDAEHNETWNRMRYMCGTRLDKRVINELDSLYATTASYGCSARFLFDYGKALRGSGLYEKSTVILRRGVEVSSDPMFLNLIGRNYQDLGRPDSAEHYYLRAIDRLPGRMYPYYLLATLYADPVAGDPDRFGCVYKKAMTLEPKVMSPAIRDMRRELDALRDSVRSHRRERAAEGR